MNALIVFAHGSNIEAANEGVRAVTAAVAGRTAFDLTETAFLDCVQPDLAAAVASVVAGGARRITVVPFFLTLGIHLQRDLPGIVEQLRRIHPGVEITVTAPLEAHPALIEIVVERATKGMN